MKRSALLLFAWLVIALGDAQGVPARPLYEPPDPPKASPTILLPGTTWSGRLFTDGEQITFHADGTLTYGFGKGGQSPGSWRLTGSQLYFEVNKWSEYQTVVEGDVIKGHGWNKSGEKAVPFLRRMNGPIQQQKAAW